HARRPRPKLRPEDTISAAVCLLLRWREGADLRAELRGVLRLHFHECNRAARHGERPMSGTGEFQHNAADAVHARATEIVPRDDTAGPYTSQCMFGVAAYVFVRMRTINEEQVDRAVPARVVE